MKNFADLQTMFKSTVNAPNSGEQMESASDEIGICEKQPTDTNTTADVVVDVDAAVDVAVNVAGDVAVNVADDVAGDATVDVAGDAAVDVAGDVAVDVAGDVAVNVAGDVADDVAGDVAGDTTVDVAVNATVDVAVDATVDATVADGVDVAVVRDVKDAENMVTSEEVANANECEMSNELVAREHLLKHPLQNVWTLWYLENDRTKSWEDMQNEITSFDTVEDFWSLYNHIKPPSEIKLGSDYSLFKKGIRPMWEDAANNNGGRWVIALNKILKDDLDKLWLDVVSINLISLYSMRLLLHGT